MNAAVEDLDALDVRDDQQGRVLEVVAVEQQLPVGVAEVLALALVLPGEVAALPDVGEAIATSHLAGALLEGVCVAGGISFVGGGGAQHAAQVDEVRLGAGAFA